jgi:glutamine---fructose-6-phosphate transaminase (isomerizing)
MCGVFGYVGRESDVGAAVLSALKTLEYRGYDSWGLAVGGESGLVVDKDVGRINGRRNGFPRATIGLGHTRWATHGGVTVANAHPHLDCRGRLAVVHNGIIENHAELRDALTARGHRFASETDSEVVAHLVEERLDAGLTLHDAVVDVLDLLTGYNAIVVMDSVTESIAAAKRVSPLVVGHGSRGATIASDALALRGHAERATYLEDDHFVVITRDGAVVRDRLTRQPVDAPSVAVPAESRDADLGHHPDFFTKEVSEQPATLRRIVAEAGLEIADLAREIERADRVAFVGCGTAGNAALAGTYLFSELCGRDVSVIPASEFSYRAHSLDERSLVIALSQSGETIDVLEAVETATNRGARVAAIVNSANSSLDRAVQTRVLLRSGVEQCVLATKSYTAKLAVLLLTACAIAGRRDEGEQAVLRAAAAIEPLIADDARRHMRSLAMQFASAEHLFVIGRAAHYASALEAALKIKEVSYIHAEGFAGGELKHGVIALVTPGTPCLVFAPNDPTRTDVLSGAAELRSRGGHIVGIGPAPDAVFHDFIEIQDGGLASPIVEAVPAQLFGYFAALARGHDPDRPRNLAKSVTVK